MEPASTGQMERRATRTNHDGGGGVVTRHLLLVELLVQLAPAEVVGVESTTQDELGRGEGGREGGREGRERGMGDFEVGIKSESIICLTHLEDEGVVMCLIHPEGGEKGEWCKDIQ